MQRDDVQRLIDEVWRSDAARIVGALARSVRDVGLAEDLAQEAVAEALERWPDTGAPHNPAAWLTTVAKRRAIDHWRRQARLDERHAVLAHELETEQRLGSTSGSRATPSPIPISSTTTSCASCSWPATRCCRARRRSS
ncbi:hypothetical protein GCM10025867_44130 [Frondihabitans sucicola]|uniref:RNA polymerase sigma factor n=1 Tax=Frondihabitans sucicola TaxID=1268041 RepID=A0ABN6Y7P6_9MICO|nr:sigma factor [Frondihabitans sucicola]BDZ52172.1 hypothetical protein GCM10025867_44130 [Frondihabitans sucicola]